MINISKLTKLPSPYQFYLPRLENIHRRHPQINEECTKVGKSTHNRWSAHFSDILPLFNVEDFILTEKYELANRDVKPVTADHLSVCKQDKNIRIAISQLVADIVFHLVESSYTLKQCWDNLRQFYCPNSAEDVDDLLQSFWSLSFEDDVDVDELV